MMKRAAWILSILGVVPFVACTLALLSSASHYRIPALAALVTYATVIVAFLGGVQWGLAIREPSSAHEGARTAALVVGVLPALIVWGFPWLPSLQWQLGTACVVFLVVLAVDALLARQGLLPAWFLRLRMTITSIVVLALGVALFLL